MEAVMLNRDQMLEKYPPVNRWEEGGMILLMNPPSPPPAVLRPLLAVTRYALLDLTSPAPMRWTNPQLRLCGGSLLMGEFFSSSPAEKTASQPG